MVLTTIFVTRHGSRSNWTTDPHTGRITGAIRSPTGIPSDPALSAYGVTQARELGAQADVLQPRIASVYSSPFYRCLQTIEPLWERLSTGSATGGGSGGSGGSGGGRKKVPLICDRGLGEWFGRAPFEHYGPAALTTLQRLFPSVEERTTILPPANGESLEELHDRLATALAALIAAFDAESTTTEPESLIICSHAAPIIAMGRALTGDMPEDPDRPDVDTYTCSISRYERRTHMDASSGEVRGDKEGGKELRSRAREAETPDWRRGKGVGGGWTHTVNAAVDHLSGGGERNWHFSGDESFFDIDTSSSAQNESLPKL